MDAKTYKVEIDGVDEQIERLTAELDELNKRREELLRDYQAQKEYDLQDFVANAILHAECHVDDIGRMDELQAFDLLIEWAREGMEFPDGITPKRFADEWNFQYDETHAESDEKGAEE